MGGFHRRRLERKKQAVAEQAEVDRLAKIEARRLRRVQVRQRIETDQLTNPFGELDDDNDDSDSAGGEGNGADNVADNDDDNGDAPPKRSIIDEADALLAGDDDNELLREQPKRNKIYNVDDNDDDNDDDDSNNNNKKKLKREVVDNDDNDSDDAHDDDDDDDDDDDNKPKKLKFRGESAVATVLVEPLNVRRKDVHEIDRLIALSFEASRVGSCLVYSLSTLIRCNRKIISTAQRNDEKSALQQARDAERREKRKAANATGKRKPLDKAKRRS